MNGTTFYSIKVKFGDTIIQYNLHYKVTSMFLNRYIVKEGYPNIEIAINQSEVLNFFHDNPQLLHPFDAEIWLLIDRTALELLKYKATIFHAAAFKWHDKAWLFTAPSGTGKTTQMMNWVQEFSEDIEIINGDKPILFYDEKKDIMISGSPWRGKERLGSNISAPLGGIVFLEQGNKDTMTLLDTVHAVLHLFTSFWTRPETPEQIQSMAFIVEQIVSQYPVWKLINRGDTRSVYLAKDHFMKYLE